MYDLPLADQQSVVVATVMTESKLFLKVLLHFYGTNFQTIFHSFTTHYHLSRTKAGHQLFECRQANNTERLQALGNEIQYKPIHLFLRDCVAFTLINT